MAWEIKAYEITAPVPARTKWFACYERPTGKGTARYGAGWGATAKSAKADLHARWASHLDAADAELRERGAA